MLKKLKFKPRDLFIAAVLVSPVIIAAYISFHPWEQRAISTDENTRGTIGMLYRASDAYFKKNGKYPNNINELVANGLLESAPVGPNTYSFTSSADGGELVIYSEATSLSWKEYCSQDTTYIVFSTADKREDLVCGKPMPGHQHFVN